MRRVSHEGRSINKRVFIDKKYWDGFKVKKLHRQLQ